MTSVKKSMQMSGVNLLKNARVYLSGPMDFVASRAYEKKYGWRNRVGEFLENFGVTVLDPWDKPDVKGLASDYGEEGGETANIRNLWTFEQGDHGAEARAGISGWFWPTMHIDLRMVDTSEFIIAYCPTSIYSVGTPHEIINARNQRKPVLFVSPPVVFSGLQELKGHLKKDKKGLKLLDNFMSSSSLKENPKGVPSFWYTTLVGGERFFDGFGFKKYMKDFGWKRILIDEHEERFPPVNPLLPFLEKVNNKLPRKWNNRIKKFVTDDDWLIWDLQPKKTGGAALSKHIGRGRIGMEEQER
jgi:hypothetical protein